VCAAGLNDPEVFMVLQSPQFVPETGELVIFLTTFRKT
jgi:hypothetical protein